MSARHRTGRVMHFAAPQHRSGHITTWSLFGTNRANYVPHTATSQFFTAESVEHIRGLPINSVPTGNGHPGVAVMTQDDNTSAHPEDTVPAMLPALTGTPASGSLHSVIRWPGHAPVAPSDDAPTRPVAGKMLGSPSTGDVPWHLEQVVPAGLLSVSAAAPRRLPGGRTTTVGTPLPCGPSGSSNASAASTCPISEAALAAPQRERRARDRERLGGCVTGAGDLLAGHKGRAQGRARRHGPALGLLSARHLACPTSRPRCPERGGPDRQGALLDRPPGQEGRPRTVCLPPWAAARDACPGGLSRRHVPSSAMAATRIWFEESMIPYRGR